MRNGLFIVIFLLVRMVSTLNAQELIEINTDDLSMILGVQSDRKVVLHHWGEKIKEYHSFNDYHFKNQPDTQDKYGHELYPAYGGRFYLNPALKLTHVDGVLTTELIYSGHKSKILDSNRKETIISLQDNIYPVFLDIHFIAYAKENVICQFVSISHKEKGVVKVENLASSYLSLHAHSYYLTHFYGTWAHEMQMKEEQLTPGIKIVESKKGVRTTQSENSSFLLSMNGPSSENSGEVYAGSLAWSGNYRISFEVDEYGLLHMVAGMNPFASTFMLKPDKTLSTPEMVLTYSPSGKGQISRNLHDWSRKYALAHGNNIRPIILNSWEGAYFNFEERTITDMIDHAADFGIEMFVLDDGWFGNKYPRNGDNAGLGDWQVNKKKLPNGIEYLAEYAVNKGIKFGIWIEPEMVNPQSELAKKHPEWIVKSGKREMLPMRNQNLLDLSNPKVQDFIFDTFDKIVSMSPHISYIKWDANRHVDNVGSEYLPKEEQSHFWYEYVRGLYNVYDRIRTKYPDIEIQLCSSGGGRLDYGALKYHDEFWASDNTNALDRIFIQYGTNIFFPAIATAAHVSTSPNHQTGMIIPLKFRFDVAMSGRLGMELQPKDIVGSDYEFAKNAIKVYKDIRPIVQFGDLYRMNSPYDENGWYSLMYVSKDKNESVFFAYSLKYHGRTTFYETKLYGLDPNKIYKIKEINTMSGKSHYYADGKLFTGDFLMKAGLCFQINNPYESIVLHLTEE